LTFVHPEKTQNFAITPMSGFPDFKVGLMTDFEPDRSTIGRRIEAVDPDRLIFS
jgi:hypothetical protein